MNLVYLYNLLEKMQLTIGCGCKVYVSISSYNALEIKAEWITEEQVIHFVRVISDQELKYIDKDIYLDWFCALAIRNHKIITVGEE